MWVSQKAKMFSKRILFFFWGGGETNFLKIKKIHLHFVSKLLKHKIRALPKWLLSPPVFALFA